MSNLSQIEKLQAELAAAKAELAKVKAPRPITVKVSPKGAVSVYGLQRFPVTLYAAQWKRLVREIGRVTDFIASNPEGMVTEKTEAPAA